MMKNIVGLIIAILLSKGISAQELNGQWNEITIPSPSLSTCILAPVDSNRIGIYLPPDYQNSDQFYPVIYYLQGYNMRISNKVGQLLDALIVDAKVKEVILVMVSGVHSTMGSFYVNSPVTGNWNDYVINDVMGYVDRHYRTMAKKESRAIVGFSMGGYGALKLGFGNTHLFDVVYSISPGLFDEAGLNNSQMFRDQAHVNEIQKIIRQFQSGSEKESKEAYKTYLESFTHFNNTEFTLAYGMAFSPVITHAPYFDFPYAISGQDTLLNNDIWKLWEDGYGGIDDVIEENRPKLNNLRLCAINCGYNDRFKWIPEGCSYYAELLHQYHIPFEMVWHAGGHGDQLSDQLKIVVFPSVVGALEF